MVLSLLAIAKPIVCVLSSADSVAVCEKINYKLEAFLLALSIMPAIRHKSYGNHKNPDLLRQPSSLPVSSDRQQSLVSVRPSLQFIPAFAAFGKEIEQ